MRQVEDMVRAEIEVSMKDYLARHPEAGEDFAYRLYFNNFNLRLPFGGRREQREEAGQLDQPFNDGSGRTSREFYADMDDAIAERGLDLEKIRVLQQEGKRDVRKMRQLFEMTFPVYVMLRSMGYTRRELNS